MLTVAARNPERLKQLIVLLSSNRHEQVEQTQRMEI